MLFEVVHAIRYDYSAPTELSPHRIRLIPRSDASQKLLSVGWDIRPLPTGCSRVMDYNGNDVLEVWFAEKTPSLALRFRSKVETVRANPFDFTVFHPALPMQYSQGAEVLSPFRTAGENHPEIETFIQSICEEAKGQTLNFLTLLCRRIKEKFPLEVRLEGAARTPQETWSLQRGSCRDLTLLFVECCRRQGFASRFVSGYYEDDPNRTERELHAWAEVYIEGGGWRGFDPTTGLAVADRHILLATAPTAAQAAPVEGSFFGSSITATLRYDLTLHQGTSLVI
jgi:transglutaminase-like putative cysteine protease